MSIRTSVTARKTTARPNESSSRYDNGPAYLPAVGLAKPPGQNIRTAVGAVLDPFDPHMRIKTSVNRQVDLLEQELSNKRISEAEYQTGRIIQAVFERAAGVRASSGEPGQRGNTVLDRELLLIYAIDDARTVERYLDRIARVVGAVGSRRLQALLMGKSFGQVAQERGRPGERGVRSVADQFRTYLSDISDAWAARGATVYEQDPKTGEFVPRIRAWLAEPTPDIETDAAGVIVPRGHGFRWGRIAAAQH